MLLKELNKLILVYNKKMSRIGMTSDKSVKQLKKQIKSHLLFEHLPAILIGIFCFVVGLLIWLSIALRTKTKEYLIYKQQISALQAEYSQAEVEMATAKQLISSVSAELATKSEQLQTCENKPPTIIHKTVTKIREPSVEEYQQWCRANTIGLSTAQSSDGKLRCNIRVCPSYGVNCPPQRICPF